ncbi:MAG: DUF5677 domain-containing protein [Terracidiphilus sp.]
MANGNHDSDARFTANLAVVQEYMTQWKSFVDGLGIYVISPKGRTFDSIAFSLLNKAYRLSKACIALLEAGYSDEAFGIARSIIECSLSLRYMTLDPAKIGSRSNDYVDFVFCEKKHFLEQCRKYLGPGLDLDAVEAFADKEEIEERWASIVPDRARFKNLPLNDWKLIESSDWNGWKIATEPHPLDSQVNKSDWIRRQFAADYRGGSAMVHCTIRSLDNVFAEPGIAFKVGDNIKTTFDHRFEPLMIIVTNLYLAVRYTFFGANIDGTDCFDNLFDDASSKLVYVRQS